MEKCRCSFCLAFQEEQLRSILRCPPEKDIVAHARMVMRSVSIGDELLQGIRDLNIDGLVTTDEDDDFAPENKEEDY